MVSLNLSVVDNPEAKCLLNNSTVTITCYTAGFPRPDVQFLEDGNVITPGEGVFGRITQTFSDQVKICCTEA